MMKRKQVQLTARQAAALRREAARRGVSDAAVIRGLIDDLVATKPRTADERWRRLERVIGKFHSREGDIAREHDRYLAMDFDD